MISVAIFSHQLKANKRKKTLLELSNRRCDIYQAREELDNLLGNDRYVERRTIDLWAKKWSFLFPLLKALKKHKTIDTDLNEKTVMLFEMFEKTCEVIAVRNEAFIEQETKRFEWLFNSIEKYPLTKSQIRAIITDEYANLVVAGAGTGKTSTIVGKAAYILKKGLAKPITTGRIHSVVHNLYVKADLVTSNPRGRRYDLRAHSIRKFFRTQLASLGIQADYVEYMMGHTIGTYHDIRMKGIEFLRGIYISSGLSIRPKTRINKLEALKELIRLGDLTLIKSSLEKH